MSIGTYPDQKYPKVSKVCLLCPIYQTFKCFYTCVCACTHAIACLPWNGLFLWAIFPVPFAYLLKIIKVVQNNLNLVLYLSRRCCTKRLSGVPSLRIYIAMYWKHIYQIFTIGKCPEDNLQLICFLLHTKSINMIGSLKLCMINFEETF